MCQAPQPKPGALWRGGSRLRSAIHANTCQILGRDKNSYVDVFKANMVAGWADVIDSRDGANAAYTKPLIGLDERNLFTHPECFRLRIHRAPFAYPARAGYSDKAPQRVFKNCGP